MSGGRLIADGIAAPRKSTVQLPRDGLMHRSKRADDSVPTLGIEDDPELAVDEIVGITPLRMAFRAYGAFRDCPVRLRLKDRVHTPQLREGRMPLTTEITTSQLSRLVGLPDAPAIIDVRIVEDSRADMVLYLQGLRA
jgi:hypothetical protein